MRLKENLRRLAQNWTPERIGHHSIDLLELWLTVDHIARYKFAQSYVVNKTVLDVACGTGYGTALLSQQAKTVVGVDISDKAIELAKRKHQTQNSVFVLSEAINFLKTTHGFDVICSFETIEHIEDYLTFLQLVHSRLNLGGTLIISSPNKEFGELLLSGPVSSYHCQEFKTEEMRDMLKEIFGSSSKIYKQRIFSRKRIFVSALFSFFVPWSFIREEEDSFSGVTDIFVVQKKD